MYAQNRYVSIDSWDPNAPEGERAAGARRPWTPRPGGWRKNVFRQTGNLANTSVMVKGGKLYALYEGGKPTEIDPVTLETLGERDLGGIQVVKADGVYTHPLLCPWWCGTRLHAVELNECSARFNWRIRPYVFGPDRSGCASLFSSSPWCKGITPWRYPNGTFFRGSDMGFGCKLYVQPRVCTIRPRFPGPCGRVMILWPFTRSWFRTLCTPLFGDFRPLDGTHRTRTDIELSYHRGIPPRVHSTSQRVVAYFFLLHSTMYGGLSSEPSAPFDSSRQTWS